MGSGGGGSSSSSGSQTNTIRYAAYIESRHKAFLSSVATYRTSKVATSPFADFVATNIDTAFLGSGIAISSYGSLFNKFSTYIETLNIGTLYSTALKRTSNSQEVKSLIVAEGALLSEELETESYPRLMTGARDLNAVMSSTFVIGKANLEATRLKLLSKFSTGVKFSLLPHALEMWKTNLEWNKNMVETYARYLQLYYSAKMDFTEQNYNMKVKHSLWPFTVLDHERAAIAALQGATNSKTVAGEGGPSTAQRAIGGALSGAASGAMIGSAIPGFGTMLGAGIGAAVGGLAGIF